MRAPLMVGLALVLGTLAFVVACSPADDPAPATDAAPDGATTIPAVCGPIGNRAKCGGREHLEPRPIAEQEECAKGIGDPRCGEARFLLEQCLYEHPVCYDDAGVARDTGSPGCVGDRARWLDCQADAGR